MEFCNIWQKEKRGGLGREDCQNLLKIFSPVAPHLTEEIWAELGFQESIHTQPWPKYDQKFLKEDMVTFVVQVNGKVRGRIETAVDISEKELRGLALSQEKIKKWIEGKKIKKTVFASGKLINFVV